MEPQRPFPPLLPPPITLVGLTVLLACGPTAGPVGSLDAAPDISLSDMVESHPEDDSEETHPQDLADAIFSDADTSPPCSSSHPCPPRSCHEVHCMAGNCRYEPGSEGAACDDANLCTLQDRCYQGVCQGLLRTCPAPDACHISYCEPTTGLCATSVVEGACDDQNLCTTSDSCTLGLCVGTAVDCDDNNPCTSDSCDASAGCLHVPLAGLPCLRIDPCVAEAACDDRGTCSTIRIKNCSDGNDCTQDSCDAGSGDCHHLSLTDLPCDDGNACTKDDVCTDGTCTGTGLLCNDDNACTNDLCSPATGCLFQHNALPCNDNNPCTDNDQCSGGVCLPGILRTCSDGNPCTLDACDTLSGSCTHLEIDWPCNDANLCTTQDRCVNGSCTGVAVDCRDTNPCTSDSCDASAGCIHTPIAAACEDGNLCTLADSCVAGTCKPGPFSPDCDDANPCTADACAPASGLCVHSQLSGPCDDKNPCTLGDSCLAGTCQPGTTDWCECSSDLDCAPLDDADLCNGILHCDTTLWPFRCRIVPNSVVYCDEQYDTQCSRQKCQPETGHCRFVHQPDGLSCDDHDACTSNDRCLSGECLPADIVSCVDPNPCVVTWCDALFGCQYQPNNVPCNDGNGCTLGDRCSIGLCIGANLNCSDGNPCTVDYCDPSTGTCAYSKAPGTCDDGNLCTVEDLCSDGVCLGVPRNCNDGKPCTADSCTPQSGCLHQLLEGPCNDTNSCTAGDMCVGDTCFGVPILCNDFNPCTDDLCSPASGCLYIPNLLPCDDGSYCTTLDTCHNGSCVGDLVNCNDLNPCTADSCSHLTGCHNEPLHLAWCSDGNLCTVGDVCHFTTCLPGTPANCDDLDNCTVDACEPGLGCTHTPTNDPACLSCGPLFPIDGTQIPTAQQLSVALLTPCDLQPDLLTDPTPALYLSATLPTDCPGRSLELVATTYLPPWPLSQPMRIELTFGVETSVCPYDDTPLVAMGVRTQEVDLLVWTSQVLLEELACGTYASLPPAQQDVQITLILDYATNLLSVYAAGIEEPNSPVSLPPGETPSELFFYVRTASDPGPSTLVLTFTEARIQCP